MTKSELVTDLMVVFASIKATVMIVVIGIIRYWHSSLYLMLVYI